VRNYDTLLSIGYNVEKIRRVIYFERAGLLEVNGKHTDCLAIIILAMSSRNLTCSAASVRGYRRPRVQYGLKATEYYPASDGEDEFVPAISPSVLSNAPRGPDNIYNLCTKAIERLLSC